MGTKFTLKGTKFLSKLVGDYNLRNTLAAIAAAKMLGIADETISQAVSSFKAPPGRLEVVTSSPFTVIVDFAHTPQAFENVLPWAEKFKKAKKNKLIHVFGATGKRYKEKRLLMAGIAAKYDDYIFLTHEDTYSEDLQTIVESIEAGLTAAKYHAYQKIFDRREAIRQALRMAKPGDVVLLTGVAHQQSMNIAGKEEPWNEVGIVEEEIRSLNNEQ